jgi:hypothetical protein
MTSPATPQDKPEVSARHFAGIGLNLFYFMETGGNPSVGTLAHLGQIDIRIGAKGSDRGDAERLIAPVEAEIRSRLGDVIFSADEDTRESEIARRLGARGARVALVEVGTNGMAAERLASAIPDSFAGGLVAADVAGLSAFGHGPAPAGGALERGDPAPRPDPSHRGRSERMIAPSAGYSFTSRLQIRNPPGMLGRVASAMGEAGGDIGAVDIVETTREQTERDITVKPHLPHAPRGEDRDPEQGPDPHARRSVDGVHARGRPRVPGDPRRPAAGLLADDPAEHGRRGDRRHGGAGARRPRAGGGPAGDGRQGDALQGIRRRGRLPHLSRDERPRQDRRVGEAHRERLRKELEIPVFHDDQHGTAVVVLAALLNALRIVRKDVWQVRVVVTGVGAAGTATIKILQSCGVRDIIGVDEHGTLHRGRQQGMDFMKRWVAAATNPRRVVGRLGDALEGAEVFIGLSVPGILTVKDIKRMARDPIVFAMANPEPEIRPEEAEKHVRVMATGRSDYPNQINNVLCFPGFFRGLLDARARSVNDEMKLAAARALAACVSPNELSEEYIIPSVFNKNVAPAIAGGVAGAAHETAVARRRRRLNLSGIR